MNIGNIPKKIARLDPSREALIDIPNDRRMQYGELDRRVCKLANGLTGTLGLAKGERVGILSKNCIEYMEIYYACARSGLIAQPVNWRLGLDEIARILNDGDPSVVITSGEYAKTAEALKDRVAAKHWLFFGANADGSYEELVSSSGEDEPDGSSGRCNTGRA